MGPKGEFQKRNDGCRLWSYPQEDIFRSVEEKVKEDECLMFTFSPSCDSTRQDKMAGRTDRYNHLKRKTKHCLRINWFTCFRITTYYLLYRKEKFNLSAFRINMEDFCSISLAHVTTSKMYNLHHTVGLNTKIYN